MKPKTFIWVGIALIFLMLLLIAGSMYAADALAPPHDCPDPGYRNPIVLANVEGVGDMPICVSDQSLREYEEIVRGQQ